MCTLSRGSKKKCFTPNKTLLWTEENNLLNQTIVKIYLDLWKTHFLLSFPALYLDYLYKLVTKYNVTLSGWAFLLFIVIIVPLKYY